MKSIVWLLGVLIGGCAASARSPTSSGERPRAEPMQLGPAPTESSSPENAPGEHVEVGGPSASSGSNGKLAGSASEPSRGESPASAPVVPTPFQGRAEVSYREFITALQQVADELSGDPDVVAVHEQLLHEYTLQPEQAPLQSFSRVRLVFEAARDGGLWDLRWAITDQMPWSDRIWEQWASRAAELEAAIASTQGEAGPSALAECDELSALFALLVRDMGITGHVALHWPYWNHVVAVWELERAPKRKVRIVVPTSQVFLSREATLGTRELPTQRVLFPYARHDVRDADPLPGPLARFLIVRAAQLGGASTDELTQRRSRLGGS